MIEVWEIGSYAAVLLFVVFLRYLHKSSQLDTPDVPKPAKGAFKKPYQVVAGRRLNKRQKTSTQAVKRVMEIKPESPLLSWRRLDEVAQRDCVAPLETPSRTTVRDDDHISTMKLIDSLSDDDDSLDGRKFDQTWYDSHDIYNSERSYLMEPPIDNIAEDNDESVNEKDSDDERRRSYEKWSVTDGEMFLIIGSIIVCQIFVFGIEYHYCFSSESSDTYWDLPDELKPSCRNWYLSLPKSKRKRFGLHKPPIPLQRLSKANHGITFLPLVKGYYSM